MEDTPPHIYKKQFEIWSALPPKKRYMLGFEMSEFIMQLNKKRIERQFPHYTALERKKELFRQMYKDDVSADQMAKVFKVWDKMFNKKIRIL